MVPLEIPSLVEVLIHEETPSHFSEAIRCCGSSKDFSRGKRIHARILATRYRRNRFLTNLLVEMYGKCCSVEDALATFGCLHPPNVFSWNNMIQAYVHNGHLEEARNMFDKMPHQDVVSWNTMIAAYARDGDLEEAKRVFDGMLQRDVFSWTTMVAAYAQRGYLEDAKCMFDIMPERDVASWNAMIQAYAQNRHLEDAERMLKRMPLPNAVSWTVVIAAYAVNGHLEQATSMFEKMPERDLVARNVLLAAYAQHGQAKRARNLFDGMPQRDHVSWNTLIAAYARNGHPQDAVELYELLSLEGLMPDAFTFVSILGGCSHGGLLHEARHHLVSMIIDHGITPTVEHYRCMIDNLGRSARLEEAENLINNMPFLPDPVSWRALLSACRTYRDSERGARIANKLLELRQQQAAVPYALVADMISAYEHNNEVYGNALGFILRDGGGQGSGAGGRRNGATASGVAVAYRGRTAGRAS